MNVRNMKIKQFKKKHNNIYELNLENGQNVLLYDEVILKYNLLIKKEILDDDISKINYDNNRIEAYIKSIKYIKSKLRTAKEIQKKLIDYPNDIINYVINRLYKEKYLNDEFYIKSYINDQINLKIIGPTKIKYNLKRLGFNDELIDEKLSLVDNNIWNTKINKYIQKKINTNHNLSSIMLINKIKNELITKGFYIENINEELKKYNFSDDVKILKREYEKAKKKFSKKYKEEELDIVIKKHLCKKGFKI